MWSDCCGVLEAAVVLRCVGCVVVWPKGGTYDFPKQTLALAPAESEYCVYYK